jgi:hypothetical protein
MLEPDHYDLLVKYDTAENLEFDANELASVCSILNLNITTFNEAQLPEYRQLILQATSEQNKVMTEIGGEYLKRANESSEVEAFRYVIENIRRIRSPYMLNILVGLVAHKTK